MENNRMGEFLAALRKSKGYTQQEVADTLGVSNKTVSSWETGASCPDVSMLPVLAEFYGVTCDEIIRGTRLTSEESASPARRERAMEHLMEKQKTNLFTVCWIAGGLAGSALLLASIVGYAALESLVGFFLGLILQAASVVTAAVCIRRIRFHVGEPWQSAAAMRFSLSLGRAMFWLIFANAAVFGFDLMHAFVPARAGLTFEDENVILQLLFAAAGALLAFLIGFPVLLHREKKMLLASEENAASGPAQQISAQTKKNALTRWRFRHILLGIVLPALVLAALSLISASYFADHEVTVTLQSSYNFTLTPDGVLQQEGPFRNEEYIILSEEQPKSEDETGRYEVVCLFPEFPEAYRKYYRTKDTEAGTLVTIYKYRAGDDEGNVAEFYAMDYRWQGYLTEITVTDAEEESFLVRVTFGPSPAEQTASELAVLHAALAIGFGALALLSLAVTIPLYIRQERKFKKTL